MTWSSTNTKEYLVSSGAFYFTFFPPGEKGEQIIKISGEVDDFMHWGY